LLRRAEGRYQLVGFYDSLRVERLLDRPHRAKPRGIAEPGQFAELGLADAVLGRDRPARLRDQIVHQPGDPAPFPVSFPKQHSDNGLWIRGMSAMLVCGCACCGVRRDTWGGRAWILSLAPMATTGSMALAASISSTAMAATTCCTEVLAGTFLMVAPGRTRRTIRAISVRCGSILRRARGGGIMHKTTF